MDVAALLDAVRRHPLYDGQISAVEVLPERPGCYQQLARPLPPELVQLLAARGIDRLYSHQAQAVEAARAGRDLVVVTGTASGKTLCYNLPILESCLEDPEARALYLFPTKALAQDQLKGLLELLGSDPAELAKGRRKRSASAAARRGAGAADESRPALLDRLRPGVYDGDTPTAQRRRIRAEANLVLSNPDMLHAAVLPYHPKWARFFAGLKYVVIDEAHMYRGILGANVACVLRRLARVCRHYGGEPTFLAASATIANPSELLGGLLGREVLVIDDDGSPRGRKQFVMWNPSPLGNDRLARRSATDDAVWLMAEAVEHGAQSLAFTRTRQAAELLHRYTRQELRQRHSPYAEKIRAYRGGYLPNERRGIEQDLFRGELRGVATTNALELGVDIGSLDVALLVNYPGTIASTWQQAGRSGRRADESLAVLLAGNDPVDQYLLRHPEYFFAQSPEHAVVDPENPYVLAKHLRAAAFELPLDEESVGQFGDLAPPIAAALEDERQIARVDGRYYYSGQPNPAHRISLRHMSDNTFSIILWRNDQPVFEDPGLAGRADNTGLGRPLPTAERRQFQDYGAPGVEGSAPATSGSASSPHGGNRSGRRPGAAIREPVERGRAARSQSPPSQHEVIANVDAISAPELVYPEAIYLHNGETYFVRSLDLEGKAAYVERRETDYYTQAVLESNVKIVAEQEASGAVAGASLAFGEVDVTWRTVAFKKIKFDTRENIGYGPVDIPSQQLPTTALWLAPDDAVRAAMKAAGHRTSEANCGLRNLAVTALPMVAMCDSRDISGVVDSQNLGASAVILYDRYPGGLGYCEKGFAQITRLLEICLEMVAACPCDDGCPSCVGLPNLRPAIHSDPDLMRGYPIPNKAAAVKLLELLLEDSAATTGVEPRLEPSEASPQC